MKPCSKISYSLDYNGLQWYHHWAQIILISFGISNSNELQWTTSIKYLSALQKFQRPSSCILSYRNYRRGDHLSIQFLFLVLVTSNNPCTTVFIRAKSRHNSLWSFGRPQIWKYVHGKKKKKKEYRVRQRGCSLTHSARTPPAVFSRN